MVGIALRSLQRWYRHLMPDVLIQDVPAEDLARIDALAARLKLPRTEYLRRGLH